MTIMLLIISHNFLRAFLYREWYDIVVRQSIYKKEIRYMQKAIFSRFNFNDEDNTTVQEYLDCVKDLVEIDTVQQLKTCYQHFNTTRFQHSINVSYYSFLVCRKLKLDYVSAARAGLLHDLYLYDWKKKEQPYDGRHSCVHPQVALETAKELTEVNAIMEDAILHHMWPMSIHMPKHKEGWALQAVDKYCAMTECILQSGRALKPSRLAMYGVTLFSIFHG